MLERVMRWLLGPPDSEAARRVEQARRLHQEETRRQLVRTAQHVAALRRARLWSEAQTQVWQESVRGGDVWSGDSSDQG